MPTKIDPPYDIHEPPRKLHEQDRIERRRQGCCKTCRYWYLASNQYDGGAGECRVRARNYPTTPEFWCGEYELERRDESTVWPLSHYANKYVEDDGSLGEL